MKKIFFLTSILMVLSCKNNDIEKILLSKIDVTIKANMNDPNSFEFGEYVLDSISNKDFYKEKIRELESSVNVFVYNKTLESQNLYEKKYKSTKKKVDSMGILLYSRIANELLPKISDTLNLIDKYKDSIIINGDNDYGYKVYFQYRGKNGFGGVITKDGTATFDLDKKIMDIDY